MLDIFENTVLNKYANDYFLMFFNLIDDGIDEDNDYKSAFMNIFPRHLVVAEYKKCKKVYNELYSWVIDDFLHKDFRPIHQHVLYRMLMDQAELEDENEEKRNENEELKSLRKKLSEEEKYYLDNIYQAEFYMDYLFEDNDFMHYKKYYETFGTKLFNSMGYDDRIIELLPRDKRKELKQKLTNKL